MQAKKLKSAPQIADFAIIGGGPAGLMAADYLSRHGQSVTLYERMPTVGRKFLMAGKSGLNLTHNEDFERFITRYGDRLPLLKPIIDAFTPSDLRQWADDLGAETYVGTSGKIFPKVMKASPLLRAWLNRLQEQGVVIKNRHQWLGFKDGDHLFRTDNGDVFIKADATIFALGGASWPKLGSDGGWQQQFFEQGVDIEPLKPANCGFDVDWSSAIKERFTGEPVKTVQASAGGQILQGEFVITPHGVEGSLIYAFSAHLRDELLQGRKAVLTLDLAPALSLQKITQSLERQNPKASLSTKLRKAVGLSPVKIALLRELPKLTTDENIVDRIKNYPLQVERPRPIEEVISSAGGVRFNSMNSDLMLKNMAGIFIAGEMLDWEAPTGGYLLTACFATGLHSACGAMKWVKEHQQLL
ncbi:TIGR03862 family flavoprotein [Paenochrobactrum pullorum]|uniref:TIGR03862 family flavoprotein n=1 Tax=Paenochrobactrum pullorum TaxID=1324351 RepID=UPI0035BBAD18